MVAFTTTADLYQAFLYMENRRVTRATEAVSPTVTDRHSHSASFTNMAHSQWLRQVLTGLHSEWTHRYAGIPIKLWIFFFVHFKTILK